MLGTTASDCTLVFTVTLPAGLLRPGFEGFPIMDQLVTAAAGGADCWPARRRS